MLSDVVGRDAMGASDKVMPKAILDLVYGGDQRAARNLGFAGVIDDAGNLTPFEGVDPMSLPRVLRLATESGDMRPIPNPLLGGGGLNLMAPLLAGGSGVLGAIAAQRVQA